jgi:hypothetical protein
MKVTASDISFHGLWVSYGLMNDCLKNQALAETIRDRSSRGLFMSRDLLRVNPWSGLKAEGWRRFFGQAG